MLSERVNNWGYKMGDWDIKLLNFEVGVDPNFET